MFGTNIFVNEMEVFIDELCEFRSKNKENSLLNWKEKTNIFFCEVEIFFLLKFDLVNFQVFLENIFPMAILKPNHRVGLGFNAQYGRATSPGRVHPLERMEFLAKSSAVPSARFYSSEWTTLGMLQ